jgi:hypothetical protein
VAARQFDELRFTSSTSASDRKPNKNEATDVHLHLTSHDPPFLGDEDAYGI